MENCSSHSKNVYSSGATENMGFIKINGFGFWVIVHELSDAEPLFSV
jgi:hypothetical protein